MLEDLIWTSVSRAFTLINPTVDAEEEQEMEHSMLQEQLDKELKELDKRLEQKEVSNTLGFCQLTIFMIEYV